jgi:type II secretory pathway pseudopilin PulG
MRRKKNGFTLIEAMIAFMVTSICLMGVIKLMSKSQRSLTQSIGSLQAQASAEELLQQIRLMRWDRGSVPGTRMALTVPPRVTSTSCAAPVGVEDWNGCPGLIDNSRPAFGPFQLRVRVDFVDFDVAGNLFIPPGASHRKRVTVTAFGRTSTATITSIFYNLP